MPKPRRGAPGLLSRRTGGGVWPMRCALGCCGLCGRRCAPGCAVRVSPPLYLRAPPSGCWGGYGCVRSSAANGLDHTDADRMYSLHALWFVNPLSEPRVFLLVQRSAQATGSDRVLQPSRGLSGERALGHAAPATGLSNSWCV